MTETVHIGQPAAGRVPNLRITFWGVQGSCPIFPTQEEVIDYAQRIASDAVEKTLRDLGEQFKSGSMTPQMIRDMANPRDAARYQKRLGLPELPTYGGDTTCVQVDTADGQTLVFDMGTGLRDFSRTAMAAWGNRPRTLHIFTSHEHLDHRSGLPFASFCFQKDPFHVHVYGTRQYLAAMDERYGVYSHKVTPAMHVDDPLDYRVISAIFTGSEIHTSQPLTPRESDDFAWPIRQAGQPISIGATTVTPIEVYHGITQCLAYKVSHAGSTFVFCTDHELRHGADPTDPRQARSLAAEQRVLDHCRDADVVYFDGQYFLEEYMGTKGISGGPRVCRMDWGHSCIEDVLARVRQCNIRRTFIGHHDPERVWGDRVELDHRLRDLCAGEPFTIELAKAGHTVEL